MRLDKWLWAARFFKTRSLATDAVDGGKVKLNGAGAKPAKDVKAGDRLHIRAGDQDWEVVVQGVNDQRRPAAEAQLNAQRRIERHQEVVENALVKLHASRIAGEPLGHRHRRQREYQQVFCFT